jgi:hypothetical protein
MAWPEKVPILDESEICRRKMDKGDRHCLVGWAISVFGGMHDGCVEFYPTVESEKVIEILDAEAAVISDEYESVMEFNDDDRLSEEEVVAVWNKTMRKLGYTVPCER